MILSKTDLTTLIEEYNVPPDVIYGGWKYFSVISKATGTDQTEPFKEFLEITETRNRLLLEQQKLDTALRQSKDRLNTLGHKDIYDANQYIVAQNMKHFTTSELKEIVDMAGNNSNKRLMEYANDELIARKKEVVLDRSSETVYDLTPTSKKANAIVPDHIEELAVEQEKMSNSLNQIWNQK